MQPSLKILENIFTIRIHLDNCTKENGALRIIRNSHQQGVIEVKNGIDHLKNNEVICEIKQGGILAMKPLILHSSKRTENKANRRIIHLEFCDMNLPKGMSWSENLLFFSS